tara:strand:+ start:1022 stop:1213 length:192 start_codon:yes stop_codon:yes gene_type:complete
MAKKRTLNEYRQVKDCVYANQVIKPKKELLVDFALEVIQLRKQYPNDQDFGREVAKKVHKVIK